ncbi:MAG: NAD(P)/FAD-dependent oxidoreductase [Alphaproteobacteria bacterium]|nr:NAD(P)/FAD-dependent oxidoreductase [Alphaproteobacteria bacterium]
MSESRKTALIIGAGPAGLTTAFELLQKTDIKPILLEKTDHVGGMCISVPYKGNLMDVGGHRYFTKFEKVKQWWLQFLPLQTMPSSDDLKINRDLKLPISPDYDPEKIDDVMLKRYKLSRIYYLRRFFDYPVSLNFATIFGLGPIRMTKIFLSYVKAKAFPIKNEKTAEDFLINTFGKELYQTFFKDYTEKLWGIECKEISAEWGRERIRGIYFWETLISLFKNIFIHKPKPEDPFLYPKLGPGQLWDKVAEKIKNQGGEFIFNCAVTALHSQNGKIESVSVRKADGSVEQMHADYVISSLPIQNLIGMLNDVPQDVQDVADGLMYRNFRAAAILLNKMKLKNTTKMATVNNILPDTWVYIQESDVKMGRMQMYNNWSPYLLQNQDNVWIAFEYFSGDNDDIWTMPAAEFEQLAVEEGCKIGIIEKEDVLDVTSYKLEKGYPAYFGAYKDFATIRRYLDTLSNLYPVGRNGLHKYINIDHVILSGIAAADNIAQNMPTKDNIWNIDLTKFLD